MKSEKKVFLKESTLSFTLQWFWVEFDYCEQLGIGIDSSFSELCRVLRKNTANCQFLNVFLANMAHNQKH